MAQIGDASNRSQVRPDYDFHFFEYCATAPIGRKPSMLKHRQDGLVGLHGTILLFLVTAAFLGALVLVGSQGWIEFTTGVNWRLYLVGVLGAMAWIHYSL